MAISKFIYSTFLTSCALLLIPFVCWTQEPVQWQLTDGDGLPSMTVYDMLQDHQGYLWLATARGLCKYDGRTFNEIRIPGLLDKEILHISEDAQSRIWFNNLSGQVGMIKNDQVAFFELEEKGDFNTFKFDGTDSLFFITYYLQPARRQQLKLKFDVLSQTWVKSEMESVDHNIKRLEQFNGQWYSEHLEIDRKTGLLNVLKVQGEQFSSEKLVPINLFSLENLEFTLEHISDRGEVFFTNDEQLFVKQLNGQLRPIFELSKYGFNKLIVLKEEYWLLTPNGIFIMDPQTFEVRSHFLIGKNVNFVFKDREKNIWIGTTGQGVFLIPDLDILAYNNANSSLPKTDVYSLYFEQNSKALYIGLSGGYLAILSEESGDLSYLKLPLSGRITNIAQDEGGDFWLGMDDGLCHYALENRTTQLILKDLSIKQIRTNGKELIYSSSNRINRQLISELLARKDMVLANTEASNLRAYGLVNDSNGDLWLGTTSGVFHKKEGGYQIQFEERENTSYSVSTMTMSLDSSIWIGTAGDGLLQVKNEQVIHKFKTENGLTSNNCLSLFSDENKIYLGTDQGVTILDSKTGIQQKISPNQGLPSGEINAVTTSDKTLWLGTPNGLVAYDLNQLNKPVVAPLIWIAKIGVNGVDTIVQNEFDLSHEQNTIDINYEGLAFRARGKESYQYRLLGLNDEWLTTNSRGARFHTLAPGDYEFQVKTFNESGIFSEQPAILNFRIKNPWWKTKWFVGGTILLLMALVGVIATWRQRDLRRQEQKENALKDRIQELRNAALRTQMNPHFIYNSLNAIQDFFVTNDQESALLYLSKFAQMIRNIFDYSNQGMITLMEEIEFLRLYLELEQLRFGDRVEVFFNIDASLNNKLEAIEIPPLLIQPVVENAFKHGLMHKLEGGIFQISFELTADQLVRCVVQDNGPGRAAVAKMGAWKKPQRNSSGLKVTKARLAMQNAALEDKCRMTITDLKDDEGNSLGTKVELLI